MKKVGFFWDFHGVLERDNVHAVVEYCNLVLEKFGVTERITLEQAVAWSGQSWYDYFKNIYPKGNDELWKSMVRSVMQHQDGNVDIIRKHIKPREHSSHVLDSVNKGGHHNIVLSNTNPNFIRTFTDMINLTPFFVDIIGVDNHLESRKKEPSHIRKGQVLAEYLKKTPYEKIIMIGDQESDVLAGKLNGAITYRFIDPLLAGHGVTEADHVIHDLRDVLREL